MAEPSVNVFGIRHHGPGSARSLRDALARLAPDCLLVEGPPDAEEVLSLAIHEDLKPPVALLIYDPEKPQRAAFYPFAVFSPEWQALQYGLKNRVPVRFIDLPQSIHFGLAAQVEAEAAALAATMPMIPPTATLGIDEEIPPTTEAFAENPTPPIELCRDPLSHLAQAAGYTDSERWWEHLVEYRSDAGDVFAAVLEAMTALREAAIQSSLQQFEPEREARREAHMRQSIRTAQKEGFKRMAVVCGAWHAPALAKLPPAKADAAILKGLPRRKVSATWIPWTYSRLSFASGYGAGIESPGWYDFLWSLKDRRNSGVATHWLTKVARLLRGEDLDASSASVIEAVRLAESIATIRGRPLPGLPELNEATQTVLCFGEVLPLQLISQKLIISERLGEVPDETPSVPLAQELAREQKRLRFPAELLPKTLDLDLRKPNDLERSRLLHRLNLLGIAWGTPQEQRNNQKGTFHELWSVQWNPEFAIALIEAGLWGNTILGAAAAKVRHAADQAPDLPTLTALLDSTLLADLSDAAEHLMTRLQSVAAVASDVNHLMGALPPLAGILRYGNVRKNDSDLVSSLVHGLVTRICIGLPGACGSLNDEAAEEMFHRILETNTALALLQVSGYTENWNRVLRQLAEAPNLHGLIAGRACRLLLDGRQFETPEAARRLGLALSTANPPTQSAAWVDGFLRESGLLLLHDETLWRVLDDWVTALTPDHFTTALPLLRRTFATFQTAERRQLGGLVSRGSARDASPIKAQEDFDLSRADQALPLLAHLLGLKLEDQP